MVELLFQTFNRSHDKLVENLEKTLRVWLTSDNIKLNIKMKLLHFVTQQFHNIIR